MTHPYGRYPPPVGPSAAPGGYQPYSPYPQRGTNGLAIASLIVSCASILVCPLLAAVGAIMGHVARNQIRQTGEDGDGIAVAGIVIGWILTGLSVAGIVVWFLMMIGVVAGFLVF